MAVKVAAQFAIETTAPIDTRMVVANAAARTGLSFLYDGLLCYQVDTDEWWAYTSSTWALFEPSATIDESDIMHLSGVETATGAKTFSAAVAMSSTLNIGASTAVDEILDEDDMVSDSATALSTQQSIKAYVDAMVTGDVIDYESAVDDRQEDATLNPADVSTPVFTGSGLDDLTVNDEFTDNSDTLFVVEIDAEGTPDTFKWSNDGGSTWTASTVSATGAAQALEDDIEITFTATTGHTLGESWAFTGTAPDNEDRYIVEDTSAIHENFKGSYADLATWLSTEVIADNDIVEYNSATGNFEKSYDVSVAGRTAVDVLDENSRYYFNTTEWVKIGAISTHNSLLALNTGDYLHLTAAEYASLIPATLTAGSNGHILIYDASTSVYENQAVSYDGTITKDGVLTIGSIGGKAVSLGGTFTTSGAYNLTLTLQAVTNVTLPTTGTLATLTGIETLTNKTLTSPKINENVILLSTSTELNLLSGMVAIDTDLTVTKTAHTSLATSKAIQDYIGAVSLTKISSEDSDLTSTDTAGLSGYNLGTASTVTYQPIAGSEFMVFINGVKIELGDGKGAYFAPTGGTPIRTASNIQQGDLFYWNNSDAGFELDSSIHRIDFIYGYSATGLTFDTLSNGSGTTADGLSVDLGGTLTGDVIITGNYDIEFGNSTTGIGGFLVDNKGGSNSIILRDTAGNSIYLDGLGGGGIYVNDTGGGGIYISDEGAGGGIYVDDTGSGGIYYTSNVNIINEVTGVFTLNLQDGVGAIFTDSRATHPGIEYAADYSDDFTNRSLIDKGYVDSVGKVEYFMFAVSDEDTAITVGTAKITFRMPYGMTLTSVRASLVGAGSTSGVTQIDINEGGTSIFSTELTIDYGDKTSVGATTAAVISDTTLADDAEITVDIVAVTGGADETGLKITFIGTRT